MSGPIHHAWCHCPRCRPPLPGELSSARLLAAMAAVLLLAAAGLWLILFGDFS